LNTCPAVYEPYQNWFHFFDIVSVVVFSVEYILRFYLAPEDDEFKKHKFARIRYATSPFALIDLVAILPFFLQAFISIDLRFLRFLRLLRILKLFRVLIPALKELSELQTKEEPSDKKFTPWYFQANMAVNCITCSTRSS
jgi:hypothetical protein